MPSCQKGAPCTACTHYLYLRDRSKACFQRAIVHSFIEVTRVLEQGNRIFAPTELIRGNTVGGFGRGLRSFGGKDGRRGDRARGLFHLDDGRAVLLVGQVADRLRRRLATGAAGETDVRAVGPQHAGEID